LSGRRERLLVAGLSARLLAEAAHAAGYRPVAADLFGDQDTRAVGEWHCCGEAGALRIRADALLPLLQAAAQDGDCLGWVAGSGFEGQPDLLARGAATLPLIGNAPEVVARVRDPVTFFAALGALGIPHPPTGREPPAALGWLAKDAAGSGGWHVRRHEPVPGAGPASGTAYYQREWPGAAMSVLFLADGREARVLGAARQLQRPLGGRPFVYRGCIGPAPLPRQVSARIEGMVAALCAEFRLRGLNGLDFLLDGPDVAVLELNARPVASIAVHEGVLACGLMRAHLRASLEGWLPAPSELRSPSSMRGCEVVFARRHTMIDAQSRNRLAALAGCHDRPARDGCFEWGDPLCSVSAQGADAEAVEAELGRKRTMIRNIVER